MKVAAKLVELNKTYFKISVRDVYKKQEQVTVQDEPLTGDGIQQGKYKAISCSGLIVLEVEMTLNTNLTDFFKIEGECVMMEFMYNSPVAGEVENMTWQNLELANKHNITFSKNYSGRFTLPAHTPIHFILIILSKEYYFNLIPSHMEFHQEFVNPIFQQHTAPLSKKMLSFDPNVHAALHAIRSCKRTGEFKRLYIDNKIQELLLLQFEIHQRQHAGQLMDGLTEIDYQKLLEAKAILDLNFRSAPGIAELARISYLNEFKLKKGFKAYFGTTIKSYVISLRMKHALKLLTDNNHSIGEIAFLCGYNGIVQFSSAFKSYYGQSPKFFRSNL